MQHVFQWKNLTVSILSIISTDNLPTDKVLYFMALEYYYTVTVLLNILTMNIESSWKVAW